MRLTDDLQSPQGPKPPRAPVKRRHVVRALLVFLLLFGVGVAGWLSVSYRGRLLTSQVLEVLGQWPQALREPEKIIAHRISPEGTGAPFLPGSFSVQHQAFAPNSKPGRAVAALFDEGKLAHDRKAPAACDEQGDFALEFVAGLSRRQVVFDFHCGTTDGDSGIHSFDVRAVAALASSLFPEDETFRLAAAGQKIR